MGAVREKTTVKLRASAQGISHSRTDVAIRDLSLTIDEPQARGGTNLGPTPTDTALAALAACTNVIGNKVAAKLGFELARIEVDIVCDFDRRGVTLTDEIDVPFVELVQTVTVHGALSEDQVMQIGSDVARFCPLSKLFEQAGTKLTTNWRKA